MLSVLSACSQHLGRRGPQVASCLHRPAASMTVQRLRQARMPVVASMRRSMFSTEAPPASPSPADEAPQPPPHYKIVVPDMGQSTRDGGVNKWRKAEGDLIKSGDVVCEAVIGDFTVGLEISDDKGYLARILVPEGTQKVPIGETLGIVVYDEAHVGDFKDVPTYQPPGAALDPEAVAAAVAAAAEQAPIVHTHKDESMEVDGVMIMKYLSKLQKTNALQDAGIEHKADLFKKISTLARHENLDIKKVFAASFEGEGREVEDFNLEFFVENAEAIVQEEEEKAAKEA